MRKKLPDSGRLVGAKAGMKRNLQQTGITPDLRVFVNLLRDGRLARTAN